MPDNNTLVPPPPPNANSRHITMDARTPKITVYIGGRDYEAYSRGGENGQK